MRIMTGLLLAAATAAALPWPCHPMDTAHHIGNAWGSYQNYGGSPYCHNGQDIMVTALSPAVAIKPGYVKAIWLGGSPMYNGVTVADSAGAAFCSGFMYYHIDNSTIRVQVGDTVAVGDTLGLIATWSVAGFHHNHFSKNRRAGVTWPDYGAFYRNPLLDLQPDDDSITPNFIDAYSGQRFAICRDNASSYQSKDSVYGTVDLICRLDERINHRLWKVAVYRLRYSIRDTFGNVVVPPVLALQFSDSLDGYTVQQTRVVYKQDATCPTRCNYDSLARQFFYIFTNTDGDSIVESTDSTYGWNTTLVSDGAYWVRVVAEDEYGNAAVDSMMVKVRNLPVNRHDVGVVAIAAPRSRVDSGATVTPACSVYNFGSATESYAVRLRIGGGYDTVAAVANHAPGTKVGVTFPDWVAACSTGTYPVRAFSLLGGDQSPANDTARDSVTVVPLTAVAQEPRWPGRPQVGQLRPSPAHGRAAVGCVLPQSGRVRIVLFDAAGRERGTPFDRLLAAGRHELALPLKGFAAGVYLVRVEVAGLTATRKLVIE